MEIISKENEYFYMAVTYIHESDKVVRPKMTFIPKWLLKNCNTFDDFINNDELIDLALMKEVEANTIDGLKSELDKAEVLFMSMIERFGVERTQRIMSEARKQASGGVHSGSCY